MTSSWDYFSDIIRYPAGTRGKFVPKNKRRSYCVLNLHVLILHFATHYMYLFLFLSFLFVISLVLCSHHFIFVYFRPLFFSSFSHAPFEGG